MTYFEKYRRKPTTTDEERERFEFWFYGEPHQRYITVVRERGGTPLDDPEEAFGLFRRRWTRPDPPAGPGLHVDPRRATR